jgi:flavorubredoxin
MTPRKIKDGIYLLGAVDWSRRLFDSLIPLPEGTSYNAYLVDGTEKVALLDTVDSSKTDTLLAQLAQVPKIDYLVAHHAEQDHSGAIPAILQKYPEAKVVTNAKAKTMLMDLLDIADDRFMVVAEGDTLALGGRTLKFLFTPWVHWPETMSTYLVEDRILFSCDFFGSHLATSNLYALDEARVYEGARRYYAEIMMPFAGMIKKNLEKIAAYDIELIAPSHGPIYNKPKFIVDAYSDWISEKPKNVALIPYISMHGSTQLMVDRLVSTLTTEGVQVLPFDLTVTDLGRFASALVDAATIVVGSSVVLGGPHPFIAYAATLVNALRPKLKFASVIGSYGWGNKLPEQIAGLIPNLKVEMLEPVICKGLPREADYQALDKLAASIAAKHREHGYA